MTLTPPLPCDPVASQHDTRRLIVTTTIDLMERAPTGEPSLHDVARAVALDETDVLEAFTNWDSLLDAAYEERFLQQQLALITGFTHRLRTCRTRDEFVELVEQSLLGAYRADRAPGRAIRIEILGRCRVRPDLAATVAAANRRATGLLGEALQVAQTRGWVRRDLDGEVTAAWILGQVNGRFMMEMDRTRSLEDAEAWDRVSVEAVLAVLLEQTPGRPARRRWRRTTTR